MLLNSLIFEILLTFDDQKELNNDAAEDNAIDVDSILTTSKVYGSKKNRKKVASGKISHTCCLCNRFYQVEFLCCTKLQKRNYGYWNRGIFKRPPGLEDHGISWDTIHYLMVAPGKNAT